MSDPDTASRDRPDMQEPLSPGHGPTAASASQDSAEGVFLGAVTGIFALIYPGIAIQALLGSAGVFVTMLVVYKTGAVKVAPKLTKWVVGALGGALGGPAQHVTPRVVFGWDNHMTAPTRWAFDQ